MYGKIASVPSPKVKPDYCYVHETFLHKNVKAIGSAKMVMAKQSPIVGAPKQQAEVTINLCENCTANFHLLALFLGKVQLATVPNETPIPLIG